MATATFKFVPDSRIEGQGTIDQDTVVFLGTVVFSAAGDTYATGGLLPLAGFDLKSLGPFGDRTPMAVYVMSRAGSGWDYLWANGTGKLKIFASAAGSGTSAFGELTNTTALNAAAPNIFTDDVVFEARFPRR